MEKYSVVKEWYFSFILIFYFAKLLFIIDN